MNNDLFAGVSTMKRDGSLVAFDPSKIKSALLANALDVRGLKGSSIDKLSQKDRDLAVRLTEQVVERLTRNSSSAIRIEDIQDQVELALMREGEPELARGYVLYRAKRADARVAEVPSEKATLRVTLASGGVVALDTQQLVDEIRARSQGLDVPDARVIVEGAIKQCYDEVPESGVRQALLLATRETMEMYPDASRLAARLVIADLQAKIFGAALAPADLQQAYMDGFASFIRKGIALENLDPQLGQFNLARLATALRADRDNRFGYLGVDTLQDRYLQHDKDKNVFELPQWLFMRVAMGLALNEIDREARAIEFYDLFSQADWMSSTPTLFNAGTRRPQLSSCYLTTIPDDLDGIYEGLKENALLSKFAGGLGNDWSRVRALGSHIKGTNGKSQGIVPFLKVVNDTAVAVNQGGKRKGAVCAYLETWHLDIEEFLELRKNTGDDRRRTHDMNTANWVPDLFMKRVAEKGNWTLFSPNLVPDLHDVYGREFEQRYTRYEQLAANGELAPSKVVKAHDLWRKMLGMIFETGHPWITFKDPCNIRNPQQHAGVVHSSNLCTEITLNTSESEIAVCNLGSVNLVNHLKRGEDGKVVIDRVKLQKTVTTAMRMLDNVIDINYYSVAKARNSNLRHRPVGLGIMGFHDVLQEMRVPYASAAAVEIADEVQELVCYYAYKGSNELARERGRYPTFAGSLWDRGVLPHESVALLEEARGQSVGFEVKVRLKEEWAALKESIKQYGMRNSNCVAIAPTATISNIVGVSQAIDPIFQNLFVKSNLGGEFTVVNQRLVNDLKQAGLWDEAMVLDLKHFDGSVGRIDRVPAELRELYATAFEIAPEWLIESAARRQVWTDQAQSLNLYMANASGNKLDAMYKLAWERGLKSTYYLRTLAATHVEKSTGRSGGHNAVPSGNDGAPVSHQGNQRSPVDVTASYIGASHGAAATSPVVAEDPVADGAVCMMRPGDPGFDECEACQ
jgi:ribonucleoside-diphosphate reductase alpha chain